MTILIRNLAVISALFGLTSVASGQVRADPGVVINGRVAVKVAVTLSDDETPYAPVTNFQLRFFRSANDSVVVRTDDAGVVTALLAPGDYRLVSGSPTEWKGSRYAWSIPLTVRAGIGLVDLTTSNAERRAPLTAPAAQVPAPSRQPAVRYTGPPQSEAAQVDPARSTSLPPKDGSTAALFSFLLTGGGQMYAGEPGRGIFLLGVAVGGAVLAVNGASNVSTCYANTFSYDCGQPNDGMVAVGLGIAVFSWVFSMVDAPAAARRYNMKHGINTAAVIPLLQPAPNGRTRVGLSMKLR